MGLGDWLRRNYEDTMYGDGWRERQQADAVSKALDFVRQSQAQRYQDAQVKQWERAAQDRAVDDYWNVARFAASNSTGGIPLPEPPAGFPWDREALQTMVDSAAAENSQRRELAGLETRGKIAKAQADAAYREQLTADLQSNDPLRKEKARAEINRLNWSSRLAEQEFGWNGLTPYQAGRLGVIGTGVPPGDPVNPADAAAWSNKFRAAGGGAPPRPGPPPPRSVPPMPDAIKAEGGVVTYKGRPVRWDQLPAEVQAEAWRRSGPNALPPWPQQAR